MRESNSYEGGKAGEISIPLSNVIHKEEKKRVLIWEMHSRIQTGKKKLRKIKTFTSENICS